MQEDYIEKMNNQVDGLNNGVKNPANKRFLIIVLTLSIILIILLSLFEYSRQESNNSTEINSTPTQTSIKIEPTISKDNTPPSETADWKTYINEEYGVSFNYPHELIFKREVVSPEYDFLFLAHFSSIEKSVGTGVFYFTVRSVATEEAIEELIRTYPGEVVKVDTVYINDIEYKHVEWEDITHNMHQGYVSYQKEYLVDSDSDYRYEFGISIDTTSAYKEEFIEILDRIIETTEFR